MLPAIAFLNSARARDRFLSILQQTRVRYRFVVVGYVVMPEHIHLLVTEPEVGSPSTVMQVLKQRTARALLPKRKRRDPRQQDLFGERTERSFWQARFYDFNVWTTKKRVEKLRYMHRNPVKRGLVESPEQWRWSSYRFYQLEEAGPVRVNVGWTEFRFVIGWHSCAVGIRGTRPFAKNAKERGTRCVGCGYEIKGRASRQITAGLSFLEV